MHKEVCVKKLQACFYFLNTTDVQHYTGLIIESAKRGINCNILVFDNTYKKRGFYYYTLAEIRQFFKKVFIENNLDLKNLRVEKYGLDDALAFFKEYNNINPDIVFTRSVKNLKYAKWHPVVEKNKTIMFYWKGYEAFDVNNNDNLLNVLLYTGKLGFPLESECSAFYPGAIRYKNLGHAKVISDNIEKFLENDKTCFMIETWPRGKQDRDENWKIILKTINAFKSLGYKIAWKTREKGYPSQSLEENSYTEKVKEVVDLVVSKDLNYPSSLYYLSKNTDATVNFNVTSTITDSINFSPNPFVIFPKHLTERYRNKVSHEWGEEYKNLEKYVNFYDERSDDTPIEEFIRNNQNKKNKEEINNKDSENLINKILKLIDA